MTGPDRDTYRALIAMAMAEDRGTGDVTSELLFSEPISVETRLVAREPLVVCGMTVAQDVLSHYDPQLQLKVLAEDGQSVPAGGRLAVS